MHIFRGPALDSLPGAGHEDGMDASIRQYLTLCWRLGRQVVGQLVDIRVFHMI